MVEAKVCAVRVRSDGVEVVGGGESDSLKLWRG
jgi:hypothetical protein